MLIQYTTIRNCLFIFLILLCSVLNSHARSIVKTDTSKVYYYSFKLGRVIEIHAAVENMEVTAGAKVVLEAPKYKEKVFYQWEGPCGFRSCSNRIVIDRVQAQNIGCYYLKIYKKDSYETGQINIVLHITNPKIGYLKIVTGKYVTIPTKVPLISRSLILNKNFALTK